MDAQQSPDVDAAIEAIDRFREAVWAAKGIDGADEQDQHATMAAFVLELESAIRAKLAGGNEVEDVFAMGLVAELAKDAGPDWTARNIPFLRELGVKLPALPEDAPRTGYPEPLEQRATMSPHVAREIAEANLSEEDRASNSGRPRRRSAPPPAVVAPVTPSVVQDILCLVSVYVRRADIDKWTDAQRELATEWAAACHAEASDNIVTVPPRPEFLPAPQNAIPEWWFRETSDPEGARRRAKVMGMAVEGDERDVITTTADNIERGRSPVEASDEELARMKPHIAAVVALDGVAANPTSLPGEVWVGETKPYSDDIEGDAQQELVELRGRVMRAEIERDNVYVERTHMVALVAAFCRQAGLPVGLGQHDPNDRAWDPAWRTIVFAEIPDGLGGSFQASWHIGDRDRELVAYLPTYDKPWDGHTTREKYLRIAATAERLATGTGETVLATWERARRFLDTINRRGGLGHKTHADIADILRGGRP